MWGGKTILLCLLVKVTFSYLLDSITLRLQLSVCQGLDCSERVVVFSTARKDRYLKICQNIQPDKTHPTLFTRRLLSLLTVGNHEGKTENIQYKRFFARSFFLSTSCSKYLLTLPNSKMVYEAGAIFSKMLYQGGIFSKIYASCLIWKFSMKQDPYSQIILFRGVYSRNIYWSCLIRWRYMKQGQYSKKITNTWGHIIKKYCLNCYDTGICYSFKEYCLLSQLKNLFLTSCPYTVCFL